MNVGTLWFDNNKKLSFEVKVLNGADYFYKKYGFYPDTCIVNPQTDVENCGMLIKSPQGNITVLFNRSIMPSHFWLGTEEDRELKEIKKT